MSQGQPVTRLGDMSLGEKGFPARPAIEGTSSLIINNKPVVIVGKKWAVHCLGPVCHDAKSIHGAPYVIFENHQVVRVGDLLSDGDISNQGSTNFFIGNYGSPFGNTSRRSWQQMTMQWKDAKIEWKNT